jgi:ankyrin repeat protein
MTTSFARPFATALALSLALALPLPAHAGAYEDMLAAIQRGSATEVAALIKRGLDPDIVDQEGNTLLMLAVRDDKVDILDVLLAARANPNARNAHGDTALRIAALRGSLPMVERLVKAKAQVNMRGWTPLIYAAFNGHTEVAAYLLDHGAAIDARADNGFTALIAAARSGHEAMTVLLLKRGANPNVRDDKGETAMDYALRGGNTDIFDRLRAAGGLSGKAIQAPAAR